MDQERVGREIHVMKLPLVKLKFGDLYPTQGRDQTLWDDLGSVGADEGQIACRLAFGRSIRGDRAVLLVSSSGSAGWSWHSRTRLFEHVRGSE